MADSLSTPSPSQRSNLEVALWNASKGFGVLPLNSLVDGKCTCGKDPCKTAGKHPRLMHWPAHVTCDLEQVTRLWTESPDCGVGIATAGILALDIDGPEGAVALTKLQQRYQQLPGTYVIKSGNLTETDHRTLLFRIAPGMRTFHRNKPFSSVPTFQDVVNVDIKCGMSVQVAAPGNLHKSGGWYSWDCQMGLGEPATRDDLTEAPSWLLSALGGLRQDSYSPESLKRRKVQGKAQDKRVSRAGSDREMLQYLASRFPIDQAGVRRVVVKDIACYLLGVRKLTASEATQIISEHLKACQPNYDSDFISAREDAKRVVEYIACQLRCGTFTTPTDHSSVAARLALCPVLNDWFSSFLFPQKKLVLTSYAYGSNLDLRRGGKIGRVKVVEKESQFIEAVLLRYQYEAFYHQCVDRFRFVESQILSMMKVRFGSPISHPTYLKYKNKFIGGPLLGGMTRSPEVELFRCIRPGDKRGEASVYEPSIVPKLRLDQLHFSDVETFAEAQRRWRQHIDFAGRSSSS